MDEAQFTMEDLGGRLLRSRVRCSDGRRVRTFRGRVPRGRGRHGLRWCGSRAHLIAARSRWSMSASPDGAVVVLRDAGSAIGGAGAVVLARIDVDAAAVRAALAAGSETLGQALDEMRDLGWCRRPEPFGD